MSKSIHAIFLDIDGTFMNRGIIPQRNVEAITKVQELGHKVFINTGRSYSSIPEYVLSAVNFDGVVAGIGSYVRYGEQILRNVTLSEDQVKLVADYYLKADKPCIMEGVDNVFHIKYPNNPNWLQITSSSDYDTIYKGNRITKITIPGTLSWEEKQLMKDDFDLWEHDHYSEFAIKGNSKSLGMKVILDHLGLGRENCIAVGDSENDVDMLEYAGLSIAMGNSPDYIKEMCDFTTLSAEDAGVAASLEKFIISPSHNPF
jgi:Cof subfamily protein (haloacid dehalogenase superfamily)